MPDISGVAISGLTLNMCFMPEKRGVSGAALGVRSISRMPLSIGVAGADPFRIFGCGEREDEV